MRFIPFIALSLTTAALALPVSAAQHDHHGKSPGSGAKSDTPGPSADQGMPGGAMNKMDMGAMEEQMKRMQEWHDKMAAAKTPEERRALMPEHMKAMQEGMAMMNQMPQVGMMSGMGSGGSETKNAMPSTAEMAQQQQLIQKRMDMMQTMMQMMMDRVSQK